MDAWQQLVATALVGTDRQMPTGPIGDGALPTMLGQLDWKDPERSILATAGAMSLHQQVGQRPRQPNWPVPDPCPAEHLSPIPSVSARHLDRVMNNTLDTLPELLELIATEDQCIPAWQLPKLLTLGRQNSELRPHILPVIGQRGRWLASCHEDWRYARASGFSDFTLDHPELKTLWEQGQRGERVLLLEQWRKVNPESARAALETVWSSALAKEREPFIHTLINGLSMADEPFLEQALDDRSKGVRQAAVEVLSRLPESRLCQRMAERVQAFVQIKSGKITVTLPKDYDPDWERDGVQHQDPVRKKSRTSDKSDWLEQMLTSAPLSLWGEPDVTIPATLNHHQQPMLMRGWQRAIINQKRRDWVQAMLETFDFSSLGSTAFSNAGLLELLSLPQREFFLKQKCPPASDTEAVIAWLQLVATRDLVELAQPWELEVSRLALSRLVSLIRKNHRNAYNFMYASQGLGNTLHPDIAARLADEITALEEAKSVAYYWRENLDRLLNQLQLRQEIYKVFRSG